MSTDERPFARSATDGLRTGASDETGDRQRVVKSSVRRLLVLRIQGGEEVEDFWQEEHQASLRTHPLIGAALFRCIEGGTETGVPGEPLVPYYAFYDVPNERCGEVSRALQVDWLTSLRQVSCKPEVYEPTFEASSATTIGDGYGVLFMAETGFDFTSSNWDSSLVERRFDQWYLDVHVRLEDVVGLRKARRFRPVYRPWSTLVLYEMSSPEILYSEENIRIRGLGPYEKFRSSMERCIGRKVGGYVNQARDVIAL